LPQQGFRGNLVLREGVEDDVDRPEEQEEREAEYIHYSVVEWEEALASDKRRSGRSSDRKSRSTTAAPRRRLRRRRLRCSVVQ